MNTQVFTRVFLAALCAACRLPAPDDLAVSPRDVIVGRASSASGIVMLTSEPALVRVDPEGRVFRTWLQKPPAKLWGLASVGDGLFAVAGFIDLVRVSSDGAVEKAARFPNPIANLVDTAEGMAAQLAVDAPGAALLMTADAGGRLEPLAGARRQSLGMARAEEGVLHLLSCSVPPRVICWLPGADEVMTLEEGRLTFLARLDRVDRISAARLIAQPTRRTIHDALLLDDGSLVALVRKARSPRPVLSLFDTTGRLLRDIVTVRPLRILLDRSDRGVRAIDIDGRVIAVPL